MKRALISPNEKSGAGARIAQVVAGPEFPVAPPLVWVDVADDVQTQTHFYDMAGQQAIALPVVPPPTADDLEAEVQALLNGGAALHVDMGRLLKAKFVSDLAHRLAKPPAQLTANELQAERNRIAAIYKAL